MSRYITWKVVFIVLVVSFIGLFACNTIDNIFFWGDETLAGTSVGSLLTIISGIAWCIGLMVLLPLRIAWDSKHRKEFQKKVREGEIDPTKLPPALKFVYNTNYRNLPKWISLPVTIIACILAGLTVLALIVIFILFLFGEI